MLVLDRNLQELLRTFYEQADPKHQIFSQVHVDLRTDPKFLNETCDTPISAPRYKITILVRISLPKLSTNPKNGHFEDQFSKFNIFMTIAFLIMILRWK